MDVGVVAAATTGWGAVIFFAGFLGNRVSAMAGFYSTYYQQQHNLNGVTGLDAWVTTISAVAGTYPPISGDVAILQLLYDAARAGGMAPPVDLEFPAIPFLDNLLP
jgi:hypothetical protein